MYDKTTFETAMLADDLGVVEEQLSYLIQRSPQGIRNRWIHSNIEGALVFAIEKKRPASLDLILSHNPPPQTKERALKYAATSDRLDLFSRLIESGVHPQNLIEVAKSCIDAGQHQALDLLFKRYGVDPETRVKPTKDSSQKIPFYDYALMRKCDGDVGKMQSHLAVLTTILGAIDLALAASANLLAQKLSGSEGDAMIDRALEEMPKEFKKAS